MDVYSFGVLGVEILTKTLPFQSLFIPNDQVRQQFPQYHQLIGHQLYQSRFEQQTRNVYDVIKELDKIKTHSYMYSSTL